ncbi:E3 ubiquitin-protein ligase RNF25 [Coccinella septempunctata]|uniref:E3 ubiquitin-protein ligase RNF25 n=1 Tax=Coccinella septempunctata TaxID=41139 RepID=UPI001D06E8B0|nr:E3 ubiquitin-protein ligase RNF25 [Coccinella septempunctata]
MAANIERVREEIEALEAIFMDDISINYDEKGVPDGIKMTIFPSTANDTEKQYVCVTLEVSLPESYPDCEPKIMLKNPRGLDDSVFDNIHSALKAKCLEYSGQPVIYELIELVRENLTESNVPTCQCAVCLYGFCDGDDFTKTQCFHYFHSFCLAEHLSITEKHFKEEQDKLPSWQRTDKGFQAVCPVCREAINCDVDDLKKAAAPKQLEDAQNFSVSNELRILQAKMRELFSYQKSRGGIINIQEEENKLLLITNSSEDSSQCDDPGPSFGQVDNTVKTNPVDRKTKRNTSSR